MALAALWLVHAMGTGSTNERIATASAASTFRILGLVCLHQTDVLSLLQLDNPLSTRCHAVLGTCCSCVELHVHGCGQIPQCNFSSFVLLDYSVLQFDGCTYIAETMCLLST